MDGKLLKRATSNSAEKQPIVTIGVPTYNRAKSLTVALESIATQTYKNLEIIVSDNASTDETQEVVGNFSVKDKRILYFRQPRNIGANENFKFVLSQARGKYFIWFADDDTCSPRFIEQLVMCLDRHEDVVLAMTDVNYLDEVHDKASRICLDRLRIENLNARWWKARMRFFSFPTYPDILHAIYGLYRTNILRSCKLDFESKWVKGTVHGGEAHILAQIATFGKVVSIPIALKTYRYHHDSIFVKGIKRSNWDRLLRGAEVRINLNRVALQSRLSGWARLGLVIWTWTHLLLQTSRTVVAVQFIYRRFFPNSKQRG